MSVPSSIRDVFDYFENLNLVSLIQDLRDNRTTQQAWLSGTLLCPIAHGLGTEGQVQKLAMLGQASELAAGCRYAAHQLGASHTAVLRFVCCWDEGRVTTQWLQGQLEELWAERRADADCMQELLREQVSEPETVPQILAVESNGLLCRY